MDVLAASRWTICTCSQSQAYENLILSGYTFSKMKPSNTPFSRCELEAHQALSLSLGNERRMYVIDDN
jgi:hypothetical protein